MPKSPAFWDGFESDIAAVPGEPGSLRVRVYPWAEDCLPARKGGPPRRPHAAWVIESVAEEPRAIHDMPPERPHAPVQRADYERRAVELVRLDLAH